MVFSNKILQYAIMFHISTQSEGGCFRSKEKKGVTCFLIMVINKSVIASIIKTMLNCSFEVPFCSSAYSTVHALRLLMNQTVLSAFEHIDRYSEGSVD